MGDLTHKEAASFVKFVNEDESLTADVIQRGDGKNAVAIDGTVQIEQLFGSDNIADTWFFIGSSDDVCDGVGAENDTVRVQIVAGCDATLYPAVDVTTTVSAAVIADPQPAKALAELIKDDLNSDSDFSSSWDAETIGENGIVHISAIDDYFGEAGERPNFNDFTVVATGTTVVNAAFNDIERRGKSTSLARDPDDPRIGILGISGSVNIRPDDVLAIYQERAAEVGGNEDLAVDGSTPVVFTIDANPDSGPDKIIELLKFYGTDTNIKVGDSNFLGENSALTNGILIELIKEGQTVNVGTLQTTNDVLARWATTASDNKIINQSGGDYIEASFNLVSKNISLVLEAGTTDQIKCTVRDNLTGISSLHLLADGFLED